MPGDCAMTCAGIGNGELQASVIIPTYRDWDRLRLCLHALMEQTYPRSDFEVIIVNNDPGNPCPYDLPGTNMKIIEEGKAGSYAARNTGIGIAGGRILAFTDSDCIPRKTWLEEGVRFFLAHRGEKCICAGAVELFYKNPKKLSMAEAYEKMFAFPYQKNPNPDKAKGLVTANAFVFKETFDDIGLFEEKVLSGGDGALYKAALGKNYRVYYHAKCIVDHPARHSLGELVHKRNRVMGGHVSKLVVMEKRSKTSAVFRQLREQWRKSFYQCIRPLKPDPSERLVNRMKVLVAVVVVAVALTFEGGRICVANTTKR
jgi:glycosyltransferase involved in cell wall biosynthesis